MKIAINVKTKLRIKGFEIWLSKTDIVWGVVVDNSETRAVFELDVETDNKELIKALFSEWGEISYL